MASKPPYSPSPTTKPKGATKPPAGTTKPTKPSSKPSKPAVGSKLPQGRAAQARQASRQTARIVARASSPKAGQAAVKKVTASGYDAAYIKSLTAKVGGKQATRLNRALTSLDRLTTKSGGKTTTAQRRTSAIKAAGNVAPPKKKKKH
jgi:hypothetical protein